MSDTPDSATPGTPYIRWAKAELLVPLDQNLGMSGVPRPQTELTASLPADDAEAVPRYCETVAARMGLDASQIHPALGTRRHPAVALGRCLHSTGIVQMIDGRKDHPFLTGDLPIRRAHVI